ncbi:MAG TPA: hypothetical protein VHA12_01995 [Candidatus Nanoarchaeia archaeon]|nr:hypothetical protein [Candidatus Nanoarchaeia archaeon]
MPQIELKPDLTHRFFDYLGFNFSKVQVSHSLSLKVHPEVQREMVFLSYRQGNHYIEFSNSQESLFVFRTRDREGIALPLQTEIIKARSLLSSFEREAYDFFFGKPSLEELKINFNAISKGVETVVKVPLNLPELSYSWTLGTFVFPQILASFIRPANEILFQKYKLKST